MVKVFQSAACIMQNEQSPHSFSKLRKAKHNQSEGVICLFKHEKQLFHPVEVEQPNPQYAALLQEQLGGGNGELKAAMQYMSQSFRIRNPKIKDLFMDIAAEELSHMEMVAQTADYVTVTGDLCADLLSNIASEQRAKVVYEYLYRQIEDKKVRETIDFLLNREEAHNQMFRDAFNEVQDSGSNQDFGTTKAAKMYFSLSNPGPNAFAGNEVSGPKFAK